jgi:hypothetical protein
VIAVGLGLVVARGGFILGELADSLGERGVVRAGVDLREELALANLLSFADVDAEELAVDAALDGDRVISGHCAERGEVDGHGAGGDRGDRHRDGAVGGRVGLGGFGQGGLLVALDPVEGKDAGGDEDQDQCDSAPKTAGAPGPRGGGCGKSLLRLGRGKSMGFGFAGRDVNGGKRHDLRSPILGWDADLALDSEKEQQLKA